MADINFNFSFSTSTDREFPQLVDALMNLDDDDPSLATLRSVELIDGKAVVRGSVEYMPSVHEPGLKTHEEVVNWFKKLLSISSLEPTNLTTTGPTGSVGGKVIDVDSERLESAQRLVERLLGEDHVSRDLSALVGELDHEKLMDFISDEVDCIWYTSDDLRESPISELGDMFKSAMRFARRNANTTVINYHDALLLIFAGSDTELQVKIRAWIKKNALDVLGGPD